MSTPEENQRPEPVAVPLIQIGAPAASASAGACGDGCACSTGDEGFSLDDLECGLDPALARLLAEAGLDPVQVEDVAHVAIEEDLDHGIDVTTAATVPEDAVATGDFTAREAGTVAGLHIAEAVLSVVCSDEFEVERHAADGDRVEAGQKLLSVTTRTRDLLTAERSALNLLCRLRPASRPPPAPGPTCSKAATPRSATPARRRRGCAPWRSSRCAAAAGSTTGCRSPTPRSSRTTTSSPPHGVAEAFKAVRAQYPDLAIEVEVDTLHQVREVLEAGADLILLDNFTPEETAEAVAIVDGRAFLESSGRLALENARAYAETGVDYLSVGALTHSSPILDIGLDLCEADGTTS